MGLWRRTHEREGAWVFRGEGPRGAMERSSLAMQQRCTSSGTREEGIPPGAAFETHRLCVYIIIVHEETGCTPVWVDVERQAVLGAAGRAARA